MTDPGDFTVGTTRILIASEAPSMLPEYRRRADLAEHFDEQDPDGYVFIALNDGRDWPQLVVTQQFSPSQPGFTPGVLLIPEQRQLFIGAGTRLLSYEARSGRWRRDWIGLTDVGFWGWERHGDVVLMLAELELAAYTTDGHQLWTTFVEPPWTYEIAAGRLTLDVMGSVSTFDLRRGP